MSWMNPMGRVIQMSLPLVPLVSSVPMVSLVPTFAGLFRICPSSFCAYPHVPLCVSSASSIHTSDRLLQSTNTHQ